MLSCADGVARVAWIGGAGKGACSEAFSTDEVRLDLRIFQFDSILGHVGMQELLT